MVWFTELFVFDDEDADSIVSVLEVLETMDEDDVIISENELSEMITALNSNTEYEPLNIIISKRKADGESCRLFGMPGAIRTRDLSLRRSPEGHF